MRKKKRRRLGKTFDLRKTVRIIILLFFIVAYRAELSVILQSLWNYIRHLIATRQLENASLVAYQIFPKGFFSVFLKKAGVDFIIFSIIYIIGLGAISVFVLPVYTITDILNTTRRLFLFSIGLAGPIVFVKNGEIISSRGELVYRRKNKPGLAFIDYNSAVAIVDEHELKKSGSASLHGSGVLRGISSSMAVEAGRSPIRIEGQGIAYTSSNEIISDMAVDLRKQVRAEGNVESYTRDGIKLVAPVFSIFTLGEEPDCIIVTKSNHSNTFNIIKHHNQEVISVEELDDPLLLEELDNLWPFFLAGENWIDPDLEEGPENHSPNLFDPSRVHKAIFATGRNLQNGKRIPWTDLPVKFTIDYYRTEISKHNFEYLLSPESRDTYPIREIKRDFVTRIKYSGVYDFQFVIRENGSEIRKHQRWEPEELVFSNKTPFLKSTPLRDAGIKIVHASFGSIRPVDESILEKMEEVWMAKKDERAMKRRAEIDLQRRRASTELKAESLRNELRNTAPIFNMKETTFAWRLLDAVEGASKTTKDPQFATRMIRMLRSWSIKDGGINLEDINDS
jgi:hypothetical protein